MSTSEPRQVVLVVDFGAQYAQLIARRVREAKVFSELVPHSISVAEVRAKAPAAIILSGGPASVYAEDAPTFDTEILKLGIPVLGICYGFQTMAQGLGGSVERTGKSEFGRTTLHVNETNSVLFAGVPAEISVWMSHGDSVSKTPHGFSVVASSAGALIGAFENLEMKCAGVQFHPEVLHTQFGQQIIENFLWRIAECETSWTMTNFIEQKVAEIQNQVGDKQVICGLSGGVDSAVAAALVHKAVGDQLTCVFVDHGLLRKGEREQVEKDYVDATGIRLVVKDAADVFLSALAGVSDPEAKRKTIGTLFIRVFEEAERELVAEADQNHQIEFLVQGTLYPDVVESGGGSSTATIKSHHNVGGLPDDLTFKLIEPLRELFKDEVRTLGLQLGLPEQMVFRHPFPGPGLGIRIVGEVTKDRLAILQEADAIVREEVEKAGINREIWQFPVVLLADVRSVGVQGDGRTYGYPIVLRPVSSEDAMTADWSRLDYDFLAHVSNRITNEVRDVNRVVLDITSKPPGTIEWE
jgi:GMP synthase (glutamine-hydrolysing)